MNAILPDAALGLLQSWLVQATLVGLVAWLVCRLGRPLPATLRYAVLGIALVKFAVPPVVAAPFSLFERTALPLPARVDDAERTGSSAAKPAPPRGTEVPLLGARAAPRAPVVPESAVPTPVREPPRDPVGPAAMTRQGWVALVYGLGVLVALAALGREAWRLRRLVRGGRPAERGLQALYSDVGARLGLARLPRLLLSPRVDSPLSLGCWRPCILLPQDLPRGVAPRDLQAVLAHELLHHRHVDLPVNLFQSLLAALWWFHPVLRLLGRELRHAQEDWCDDALVRRRVSSGEEYCEALLHVARNLKPAATRAPALAVAMTLPPHALERRFRRLLHPGWKGRLTMNRPTKLLVVLAAAALLPGTRTLPATPAALADPASLWTQDLPVGFEPVVDPVPLRLLPGEDLVITLDAGGDASIAGRSVDESTLKATLAWALQSDPDRRITLSAHKDCPVATFIETLELVKSLGARSVSVSAAQGTGRAAPKAQEAPTRSDSFLQQRSRGGGKVSGEAVQRGLDWLKRHQHPDGFWDADGFMERCEGPEPCNGKGDSLHDVGVTAMALMAFLGEGNTTRAGPHAEVVWRAADFLLAVQDPEDGCFGTKAGQHFAYNHALATLALVETCHLSGEATMRPMVQKGLDFILRARNPYKAWRYAYPADGDNDVSVTGWMMYALLAGKDAGFKIDPAALRDGLGFVHEMTDPATGRTGYHQRGSPPAREPDDLDQWPSEQSESLTALGILLRLLSGETPEKNPELLQSASLLAQKPPVWDPDSGRIDFYYWYYGTYASWQLGGRAWTTWQQGLLHALVPHQRQDGDLAGSWDPQVDPWGNQGGRVYATALNTLCLEVYYRYSKVLQGRQPD